MSKRSNSSRFLSLPEFHSDTDGNVAPGPNYPVDIFIASKAHLFLDSIDQIRNETGPWLNNQPASREGPSNNKQAFIGWFCFPSVSEQAKYSSYLGSSKRSTDIDS